MTGTGNLLMSHLLSLTILIALEVSYVYSVSAAVLVTLTPRTRFGLEISIDSLI